MIRFGLIGTGWRAEFFARIARALPEIFRIVGVWNHREETGRRFCGRFSLPYIESRTALLGMDMDFVVNCCSWEVVHEYNLELISEGIAVLAETPPTLDEEGLNELWELLRNNKVRFQVAEQYFLQPYHQSVQNIVDTGLLGKPCDLMLSMMHGYHAVSVMRRLLKTGMTGCEISGRKYIHSIIQTCGRDGLVTNGEPYDCEKYSAVFEFDNGTQAYYDFAPEQYFSRIRSRSLRLCGQCGEVNDHDVRHMTSTGEFACQTMQRVELGHYSNNEGFSLRGIMLGERYLYRNPFEESNISDCFRLNDDELAIAEMLCAMKTYTDTGREFYPLADAFEDTYLSFLLTKAVNGRTTIQSTKKLWHIK